MMYRGIRYIIIVFLTLILSQYSIYASPIKVLTRYGSPLSNALVKVVYLDGTSKMYFLDNNGELMLRDVPLGIVKLKILSWKNISINFERIVTYMNSTIIYNDTGILVIRVLDYFNEPINGVNIKILYDKNIIEISSTNSSGIYVIELPKGNYTVLLKYYRENVERNLTLYPGKVNMYSFKLNIIILFSKIALSFTEFMMLLLSIFLLVVIVFIILYEYHLWRRRRLLKTVIRYERKK